jgi:hypothetical protein
MGLLATIRGWLGKSDRGGTDIFEAGFGAHNSLETGSINRQWLEEYHRNGAMRTPFNRTAEDVAMVAWHLHRVWPGEKEEVFDHPFLSLMATPAVGMTGYEWRLLKTLYLDIAGESFDLIEFDRQGLPTQLSPIPPTWCRRIPSSDRLSYDFVIPGPKGGTWEVPAENILWMKRPNLANPWGRGRGVALSVDDEIQQLSYMNKFNGAFFKNGAHPGMIIGVENLNKDNEARIRAQFERKYSGVMNAFRTAFIGGAVKVFRGMAGHKDLDFNVGWVAKRDAVRQAAGPPAELCGDTKGSNRAQIQGASNIQQRYQMRPRLAYMQGAYASFLLPLYNQFERQLGEGGQLVYTYEDPVEEAAELRLAVASEGLTRGALSINEWRHSQGWDTKAELDLWQVPLNVTSTSLGAYAQTLEQQQAIANGTPTKAVGATLDRSALSILDRWRLNEDEA